MRLHGLILGATVFAVSACVNERETGENPWIPSTQYDRYVHSIREAGLDGSAVVQDWLQAGDLALERALPIFAPYKQVGFFDPSETRAEAYRIEAYRGQKLVVEFEVTGPDSLRIFVDLFRAPQNVGASPVHVASADSTSGTLEFIAYWDGAYILRLQPELLRGGRYQLTVRNNASLEFPVARLDTRAIQSVWGDSRDGGSRSHQGVDIFAPRGTPVVATGKGTVGFVGTNRLGGNVVWLRDAATGQSL
jgi:murein DD-endopeptidase MepM/ murein hydrolase activator NlpD